MWNYDLANGDYLVTLASGDPHYAQGPHTVEVEGTTFIDAVSTSANEYITIPDQPVTVTDGQLTVTLTRTASTKTMLNDIIITPVSSGASLKQEVEPKAYYARVHRPQSPNYQPYVHNAVRQSPEQPPQTPATMRLGGGPFSLRFGLPQLADTPANPLVHLVSHGGAISTNITPAANSVLPGASVTFSWSYIAGGGSGANVPYKYTGQEQDDSTGLYFLEARYYDPVLGRFISADTIVPDPNNPQAFNRYSYVFNNPLRFTDPSGQCPECGAPGSPFFGPTLPPVLGPPPAQVQVLPTVNVRATPLLSLKTFGLPLILRTH